eukprot:TRINITY_DN76398_c0_g1_i1.p1 TRINITY_DN76398_c0_g1~~TRINITY_DN76398_c0_g1_i1.p1  ORF type:complete len:546 (-),score=91.63 TRINITY_DN76398_c0_g1_i1:377-2014(-)
MLSTASSTSCTPRSVAALWGDDLSGYHYRRPRCYRLSSQPVSEPEMEDSDDGNDPFANTLHKTVWPTPDWPLSQAEMVKRLIMLDHFLLSERTCEVQELDQRLRTCELQLNQRMKTIESQFLRFQRVFDVVDGNKDTDFVHHHGHEGYTQDIGRADRIKKHEIDAEAVTASKSNAVSATLGPSPLVVPQIVALDSIGGDGLGSVGAPCTLKASPILALSSDSEEDLDEMMMTARSNLGAHTTGCAAGRNFLLDRQLTDQGVDSIRDTENMSCLDKTGKKRVVLQNLERFGISGKLEAASREFEPIAEELSLVPASDHGDQPHRKDERHDRKGAAFVTITNRAYSVAHEMQAHARSLLSRNLPVLTPTDKAEDVAQFHDTSRERMFADEHVDMEAVEASQTLARLASKAANALRVLQEAVVEEGETASDTINDVLRCDKLDGSAAKSAILQPAMVALSPSSVAADLVRPTEGDDDAYFHGWPVADLRRWMLRYLKKTKSLNPKVAAGVERLTREQLLESVAFIRRVDSAVAALDLLAQTSESEGER